MTSLCIPQWLLTSLHFHLLLLHVLLILPYHLSLICPSLLIHLPSSSAFIPCLQWRHLLGPSALPSFTSIFLILARVAVQTSRSNLWREIQPFRVSSQGRISGQGEEEVECMPWDSAGPGFKFWFLCLPSVRYWRCHAFHLWNEGKTTQSWTRLLLKLVPTLTLYHFKATSAQSFSVIPTTYQVECRNQFL